ncbi:hypothetical protein ACFL17_05135 [Pseudomonadota bacterium]
MTTTTQTQSDQVHLADFAAAIYRRRWLIVGGTLLGILLALGGRLLVPQKYQYRSVIEIGRLHNQFEEDLSQVGWTLRLLVKQEGLLDLHRSYTFIERSEQIAASLRLIGFSVFERLFNQGDIEPSFSLEKDFYVKLVRGGGGGPTDLIEASLYAPKGGEAVEFMRQITQELIAAHSQVVNAHKQQTDKIIAGLEEQLRRLVALKETLEPRFGLLTEEKKGVKTQVEAMERRLDELLEVKSQAITTISADPLDTVPIDNALYQTRVYIDALRVRLGFDIPNKAHDLRLSMADAVSRIAGIEKNLLEAKAGLDKTVNSRVIVSPEEKAKSIPRWYSLYAILGALLGALLSLIVALAMEFWANNKSRITGR